MFELGQIDICTEVSMLSSFAAMLHEGHLEVALHVFSYLKSKSNSRLIFDPKEPNMGKSNFMECDWSDFYLGTKEVLPHNARKPLGKGVMLRMFVESNHPGDNVS
jgi:hypothetical protein